MLFCPYQSWAVATSVAPVETISFTVELGNVKPAFHGQLATAEQGVNVWEDYGERYLCCSMGSHQVGLLEADEGR